VCTTSNTCCVPDGTCSSNCHDNCGQYSSACCAGPDGGPDDGPACPYLGHGAPCSPMGEPCCYGTCGTITPFFTPLSGGGPLDGPMILPDSTTQLYCP
jgi:hypothetical protein